MSRLQTTKTGPLMVVESLMFISWHSQLLLYFSTSTLSDHHTKYITREEGGGGLKKNSEFQYPLVPGVQKSRKCQHSLDPSGI